MDASRATSDAEPARRPAFAALLPAAVLVAVGVQTAAAPAPAQVEIGGDVRLFAFRALEEADAGDEPGDGAEGADDGSGRLDLGIARLKLDSRWRVGDRDRFRFELHGTAQATSPRGSGAVASIATGDTRRFFDLTKSSFGGGDVAGVTEVDRLNLRWDRPGFRLVAGRQAITWGVNHLWPVLDLFGPFAPQRVDRDYKPGVDALRLVVPRGDFSEVELVVAGQGARTPEDLSVATFGRFHSALGDAGASIDFGYMVGGFHRDFVLGGFLAADVGGTGLRGEAAWTSPGCSLDALHPTLGCGDFWRVTAGVDRLLTPRLTLIAEATWNGFGARDPGRYEQLAESDRIRRGEVTSLGRRYAGLSLAWQAHPLVTVTGAALWNADDGSFLLQPGIAWSMADSVTLTVGLIAADGRGLVAGSLQSEYGAVPLFAWTSLVVWF